MMFFERRLKASGCHDRNLLRQARCLHAALVGSVFDVPSCDPPRRQWSISFDGTPVVYSVKFRGNNERPGIRLVVEPGGVGTTVAEQIDWSLLAANRILETMGWSGAAPDVNAINACIFPRDARATAEWWGGIWLGMALEEGNVNLRMYLNLRHGDARERWQRFANIVAHFGDSSIEAPFRDLLARLDARGLPVGLCCVIDGRVRGFRMYFVLQQPSVDAILAACPPNLCRHQACGHETKIADFCAAFTSEFGSFARQSVTLGYDFVIEPEGRIRPAIERFKTEISCQFMRAERAIRVGPWFSQQLKGAGLDAAEFTVIERDFQDCFPDFSFQYVTLGISETTAHLTAYCQPNFDERWCLDSHSVGAQEDRT